MSPIRSKVVAVCRRVPWYTEVVQEAKCKRRHLECKWRSTQVTVHRQMFEAQRQVVRDFLEAEKTAYYTAKVGDYGSDHMALFLIMDDLWHKPTPSALPKCASLQELVEQLGSFFRTKIDNIRQRLNSLPETSIAQPVERRVTAVLREFASITELKVLKMIRSSPKKTCLPDPMPTQDMMDYVHDLLLVITRIINVSHAFSHIPASMKTALVMPLIKKPSLDKEVLQN